MRGGFTAQCLSKENFNWLTSLSVIWEYRGRELPLFYHTFLQFLMK
jgi:hypothetical protein